LESVDILAITQARRGSSRLPDKVLKLVGEKTLLEIHVERILKAKKINQLVIATTITEEDKAIVEVAKKLNLPFYCGSVQNVLDRFYQTALIFKPKWVVRLTSDCPLIDPDLIDDVVNTAIIQDVDYCSNTLHPTFPDGMDVEVFKFSALERAWKETNLKSDTEHVTPYIYKNSTFYNKDIFSAFNYVYSSNYSHVRLTVDESFDFDVIVKLIEKLGTNKDWKSYADYYLLHKNIHFINEHIERNEGYKNSLNNNSTNDK
jgi:spore coat polysaccharide biosynthesis protein SpsF